MPKVYTCLGTKGGTGKTTSIANLGGILADAGHRVLLVDADVQPTLSTYYTIVERADAGLTRVFETSTLDGCVSRTDVGCDLVVSDDPQARLAHHVHTWPDGRMRLKRALIAASYDVVLVDTQGAVSPLLEAAVLAADTIITPVHPSMLSAREYKRGTLDVLERLSPMKDLNLPVGNVIAFRCMVDRTRDAREVSVLLRDLIGSLAEFPVPITLAKTAVPSLVVYKEAAAAGRPVHLFGRRKRRACARDTMIALADELWPGVSDALCAKEAA